MVKQKLALSLVLLTSLAAQRTHAVSAGDEVPTPNWWEQVDAIVAALDGVADKFVDSTAFYNEWEDNLCPLKGELASRDAERRALFDCVRASFAAKIDEIGQLNTTIDKRNTFILELNDHVAYLELEIDKINQDITNKQTEIADATTEYETLLGGNEEQANRLLAVVSNLSKEYAALTVERDEFRGCLEGFYGELQKHTAQGRVESATLSQEICPAPAA